LADDAEDQAGGYDEVERGELPDPAKRLSQPGDLEDCFREPPRTYVSRRGLRQLSRMVFLRSRADDDLYPSSFEEPFRQQALRANQEQNEDKHSEDNATPRREAAQKLGQKGEDGGAEGRPKH